MMSRRAKTLLAETFAVGKLATMFFGSGRPALRWARRAFRDFDAPAAARAAIVTGMALDAVALTRLADALTTARDARSRFADAMLAACARVDRGGTRHRSMPLRSYVDVS